MNANVAASACTPATGTFANAIAWRGGIGASVGFASMRSAEAQMHIRIMGMQEHRERHILPAEPAGRENFAT